mmetsp:Transcript_141045/g.270722  ORF Transcript_141045/g.270722 Transcript_141045/m.270722 type:complete len:98 (+) Transcript_141045:134-427(+)
MNHKFLMSLLAPKIQEKTKDFLLSSPLFHKFARESSKRGQAIIDEVMKNAEPTITRAAEKGKEAMRAAEPAISRATQKGQEAIRHLEKAAAEQARRK